MVKILGYASKEALLAIDIKSQLYFKEEDRESAALQEKLEEMATFRLRKADGSEIWVEDHGRHVLDETGAVMWHEGVLRDVTERVRAQAALRESVARQGKMVANIGDVIVIIDAAGVNRYKSPNLEKWFGWRPDEVVGAPALANVHPDDVPAAAEFISALLGTPNATGTTECRYRCKNGAYKWIEFTGVNLVHDPDICGVLGNYHDITERKLAEAEKAQLQAQLTQAQKMDSVGRLAGGVAHDFNNMLTAIQGNVSLALEELPLGSPLFEYLDEIQKCAQRSADLTRQLLTFARKQTIAPKVLDLNATVEGMLKMLGRLVGEDIALAWHPATDLWPVKLDPSQIDQVLVNLCVNARDAIGGVGKITIQTANFSCDEAYVAAHAGLLPGDYVLLSVSDTGCGMDQEVLGHLFEPFFTTKGVGHGTGLGLSTVYGVVKQNEGAIQVHSEPGRGATFKLFLPRHAELASQVGQGGPALPAIRGHETILLVEDEPSILRLGTRVLERLGYTVLAAGKPSLAIRLAEAHPSEIHLLITDVVMPEMNGRDLATRIIVRFPGIKRLFMSGYTANIIAQHGVLDEGVHFVQKPFTIPNLAAKVREALEH
jgi:PAS domain S-box-containing protein